MPEVMMVAVIAGVIVVVKVLVWDAAIVNMVEVVEVLATEVLPDVEVIIMGVILNVLKVALTVSCSSVYVSSGVAVDLSMDALMLDVLSRIGIEVVADLSANDFAVVMTALEFPVSTPLEEFSRSAAFDCLLLDCARVLQTWMPSYHV